MRFVFRQGEGHEGDGDGAEEEDEGGEGGGVPAVSGFVEDAAEPDEDADLADEQGEEGGDFKDAAGEAYFCVPTMSLTRPFWRG